MRRSAGQSILSTAILLASALPRPLAAQSQPLAPPRPFRLAAAAATPHSDESMGPLPDSESIAQRMEFAGVRARSCNDGGVTQYTTAGRFRRAVERAPLNPVRVNSH